jgi:hypothetical protein
MNKLIKKILEQPDYDRYLFLTFENDEIIGLNFHHGIGDPLDYYFATPCPHLTEIYRRLTYDNDKYKNENWDIRVNKAISIYTMAFIFNNDEEDFRIYNNDEIKTALNNIIKQLN